MHILIPSQSEERVRKGAEKLTKFLHAKQQGRLDGFFTVQRPPVEKGKNKGKDKGKETKGGKRKVSLVGFLFLMDNHVNNGI